MCRRHSTTPSTDIGTNTWQCGCQRRYPLALFGGIGHRKYPSNRSFERKTISIQYQWKTERFEYKIVTTHQTTQKREVLWYGEEIIKVVAANSRLFYIRANKCEVLSEEIRKITDWRKDQINFKEYQLASIAFTNFLAERNYRLVIMREKSNDLQLDLFDGEKFSYRCILTNDWESTEKEIIEYYNARGTSEKTFDILNNDFGWKHLPTSNMATNTVYLMITAMLKNFYNHFLGKVTAVFKNISPTSRLKRFIFRFISIPGRYVYRARQWVLQLYSDRPYERIFTWQHSKIAASDNARQGEVCLIVKYQQINEFSLRFLTKNCEK